MRVFVSDCIFSGVEVKIFIDFREYARACERAVALLIGCYLTRQKMAIQICERAVALLIGCYLTRQKMAIQIDGLSSCHIIQDFFNGRLIFLVFITDHQWGARGKIESLKSAYDIPLFMCFLQINCISV